jgi:hypothetical protein
MVYSPSMQYFSGNPFHSGASMIVQIVDIECLAFGETKDHSPVSADGDYQKTFRLIVEGT